MALEHRDCCYLCVMSYCPLYQCRWSKSRRKCYRSWYVIFYSYCIYPFMLRQLPHDLWRLLMVYQQLSDRNCTFLRIFQSVLTIEFWHRHFQKGYLKSILKLSEIFVKIERKIEIIHPENIKKITQISGSGTTIIRHQGFRASKMAFQGLKLRYPNTTAFVWGKHVNFLIVCKFIS